MFENININIDYSNVQLTTLLFEKFKYQWKNTQIMYQLETRVIRCLSIFTYFLIFQPPKTCIVFMVSSSLL